MKKNTTKHTCKHNKSIKYGKTPKGIQRYKCKICKKTWTEERPELKAFSKTEKRALSLLLNIIDQKYPDKLNLKKSSDAAELFEFHSGINKKQIVFHNDLINKEEIEISCYKPTLLICQDKDLIDIFGIPDGNLSENASKQDEKNRRKIIINDDVNNKNCRYITQ